MSHYMRVQTTFKDKDCLISALETVGFPLSKLEIFDIPQNLYGYQGDVRKEKANIIIRRKHVGYSSNDIGFFKNENGEYEAIISEYDQSYKYNDGWLANLKKEYSVRKVRKECLKKGYTVQEKRQDTGKIRLVVKGWQ